MNRTIRAVAAAILILIIVFSAISITQNIGKRWKIDVTDQSLYTLSDGTKAILARLNQPMKARLYYAATAALKGPDQIRYFNNYYEFVKALLEEYVAASKGMVQLEVIDPRPFSEDEEQALRYNLQRFPITQEENFFFGLVVQTQFGVEKVIPFFSPDRQNFVEYDISYLIDTAITREKKRLGIMSALPVLGEEVSGYMAQMMRMQNQQPAPPWTIVEQLRRKYEVSKVPADTNDINDVDILLVIHPKDLPEQALFAIDQFVLKGGRTIVCVDPHCIIDRPKQTPMQMTPQSQSSDLNKLMRNWGLEMPADTFAGDRSLALPAVLSRNQRPEKVIGYLELTPKCFNSDNAITTDLNQVRILFAGVLRQVEVRAPDEKAGDQAQEPNDARQAKAADTIKINRIPLVTTTNRGNSWSVGSPYELMFPDPAKLMSRFVDGTQPVAMGYLVTGRFMSSFPEGIEIEVEADRDDSSDDEDPNETKTIKKRIKGLNQATEKCAVVVFSDVDFLSDQMAYQRSFFGNIVFGDNSSLLLNAIEDLGGSTDLISIRSRGNFKRPFVVVDEIESQAEAETAEEVAKLNAQIEGFNKELQSLVSSAKEGEEDVLQSAVVQKKQDLELKIRQVQRELRDVKLKRRERIDKLGNRLRNINMGAVPAVITLIAFALGIRRGVRRRHYVSHASDA